MLWKSSVLWLCLCSVPFPFLSLYSISKWTLPSSEHGVMHNSGWVAEFKNILDHVLWLCVPFFLSMLSHYWWWKSSVCLCMSISQSKYFFEFISKLVSSIIPNFSLTKTRNKFACNSCTIYRYIKQNNIHGKMHMEWSKCCETFNFRIGLNSKMLYLEAILNSCFISTKRFLNSNSQKGLNYLSYVYVLCFKWLCQGAHWVHALVSSECGMCVAEGALLCCTSRKDLSPFVCCMSLSGL